MTQDPANAAAGAATDEQKRAWSQEFDATADQIDEAIAAVGANKADIELHLKGSRSSSNSDRVHDAGA